ncbi:MAG: alginate lyase family protein, partial [Aquisalinus sp.]|nr:alginate lyase family protein [Aquisalinus sp.]
MMIGKGAISFMLCLILLLQSAVGLDIERDPVLTIKPAEVIQISGGKDRYSLYQSSLEKNIAYIDDLISKPIEIPVPKDPGGGYTHEQHKQNYNVIYTAGLLYQITGQEKYAAHVRQLLLGYVELYPSLGDHPQKKEQSPGRLFWQNLNESVWLVHSIQGYDAILTTLSSDERDLIEN